MTDTPLPVAQRLIRIEPARGLARLRIGELWGSRELLYFLIWRDIKVRYKQTALGASWAVLQPLTTTIVFALFFGRLAHIPSENVPYPLFALGGLVLWTFFAQALSLGSQSMVAGANLITKVYFPRILVPIASATSFFVDLLIGSVLLVVILVAYGRPPGWTIVFAPVFVFSAYLTALGTAIGFSSLNVRYRDFKYIVPFLTQIWMFTSPVAYPTSLVSGKARLVFALNPMVGAIDGFRWAFVGTPRPQAETLAVSFSVTLVILIAGVVLFRKMESTFADEL